MTDKQMRASEFHKKGLNCSQSVACAFSTDFDLDEATMEKISSGFGGGIGRLQQACGAVTGAVMILGLKYWKNENDVGKSKADVYERVNYFTEEFKKLHKSIVCSELLGLDLKSDEGKKRYKDENLSQIVCEKCILDAVSILEKLFS